jgi:hypothetical protein
LDKFGLTGPTLPACPPWFDPYGVLVGVGSKIACIVRQLGHFAMEGASQLPVFVGLGSNNARSISVWFTPRDRSPEHGRGVGKVVAKPEEPDALAKVWCAGMDSTHHARPTGVACLFHSSENPVSAASSEARHVLSSSPTGLDFSDDADEVEE